MPIAARLPGASAGSYYPIQLIRAVTLTRLFSGLRSDEIARLRVGCIRRQHDGARSPVTPARSASGTRLHTLRACPAPRAAHKST